ncbi:hypothetical protein SMU9_06527 [Streptococcus mutans 1ID3]|nr:hypothetical protein SMU9_06527 [Streptococcus mutans 1ID3]
MITSVLFQSVRASKPTVRNESELPLSVVKVNPAGITERAGVGAVEPLEWGRRLELLIVTTGTSC